MLGAAEWAPQANTVAHYAKMIAGPGIKDVLGEAEIVEVSLAPKEAT